MCDLADARSSLFRANLFHFTTSNVRIEEWHAIVLGALSEVTYYSALIAANLLYVSVRRVGGVPCDVTDRVDFPNMEFDVGMSHSMFSHR